MEAYANAHSSMKEARQSIKYRAWIYSHVPAINAQNKKEKKMAQKQYEVEVMCNSKKDAIK